MLAIKKRDRNLIGVYVCGHFLTLRQINWNIYSGGVSNAGDIFFCFRKPTFIFQFIWKISFSLPKLLSFASCKEKNNQTIGKLLVRCHFALADFSCNIYKLKLQNLF